MTGILPFPGDIIGGILAGMSRELRCTLCFSTLNEATSTFCGHTFCKNCIESQVSEKSCCSICSESLDMNQLHPAEPLQGVVVQFMQMKDEFERAHGVELSTVPISSISATGNKVELPEPIEDQPVYHIVQLTKKPFDKINIPNVHLHHEISSDITHVVVDTVNHSITKNTHEYRLAVLYGCFIVSDTWLRIGVEQNHMCPEERFEVLGDDTYGRTGAPVNSRIRRESNKPNNLFKKLKVSLVNDNRNEYHQYLTIGRAEIGDFDDLIVCNTAYDAQEIRAKHPGKTLISCKWIDDSIGHFELEDKSKYLIL